MILCLVDVCSGRDNVIRRSTVTGNVNCMTMKGCSTVIVSKQVWRLKSVRSLKFPVAIFDDLKSWYSIDGAFVVVVVAGCLVVVFASVVSWVVVVVCEVVVVGSGMVVVFASVVG